MEWSRPSVAEMGQKVSVEKLKFFTLNVNLLFISVSSQSCTWSFLVIVFKP